MSDRQLARIETLLKHLIVQQYNSHLVLAMGLASMAGPHAELAQQFIEKAMSPVRALVNKVLDAVEKDTAAEGLERSQAMKEAEAAIEQERGKEPLGFRTS